VHIYAYIQFRGYRSLALCHMLIHHIPAFEVVRKKYQSIRIRGKYRYILFQNISCDSAATINSQMKPLTLDGTDPVSHTHRLTFYTHVAAPKELRHAIISAWLRICSPHLHRNNTTTQSLLTRIFARIITATAHGKGPTWTLKYRRYLRRSGGR
jgi:hypothetical protein